MRLLSILLFCLAATPVLAFNWGFLQDAPANRFKEGDFTLMQKTLKQVLEGATDGESREWSNPATGAMGRVRVLSSYRMKAMPCRRVEIFNQVPQAEATSRYDFCRTAADEWKIVSRPRLPKPPMRP